MTKNIKEKAQKADILLGNGYDIWKETTFRIANFPAISDKKVKLLEELFWRNKKHLSMFERCFLRRLSKAHY